MQNLFDDRVVWLVKKSKVTEKKKRTEREREKTVINKLIGQMLNYQLSKHFNLKY